MAGSGTYIFAAAALAGIALLAPGLRTADAPTAPARSPRAEAAPSPSPLPTYGNGIAGFSLPRAADGHFYADAEVNGANIRFIVDTGATSVVLTAADAQRAGLGSGDFTASGVGAGGTIRLRPVTLARLALGPIEAADVPAMVAEQGLPVSLLGQSYLARLGSVTIARDTMVLR
jgi:aspartyl protease family protein